MIRTIPPGLVNCVTQTLPSGPATTSDGPRLALRFGVTPPVNSVTTPAGVTFEIRPAPPHWVIHTLPSGPRPMPSGFVLAENPGATPPVNSVNTGSAAGAAGAAISKPANATRHER